MHISRVDALAVLEDQRAQIETVSAQLLIDLHRTLLPLSFPEDSAQWHQSVPRVIRNLNLEYRHDCKFDIIEGARKIRRMYVPFDDLVARVVGCKGMRDNIAALDIKHCQLRALYATRTPQMIPPLVEHYSVLMSTVEASQVVFNEYVGSIEKTLSANKAVLEVMTLPRDEVRIFAMRLSNPASPRANILGVRPLLAQLCELKSKRVDIENQSEVLFTHLREGLTSHMSVPASEFHVKMIQYNELLAALEGQEKSQEELLNQAKVYFDHAARSPTTVKGLWPDTFLEVATLREAHIIYAQIIEELLLMEQLYLPLRHAMIALESHMRRGVPLRMSMELFDFACFVPTS